MTPEEKRAALMRAAELAAPADGLTPAAREAAAMFAAMLCTYAAIQAAENAPAREGVTRQEWARRSQVATFFGVTANALDKWLPDLIRRGLVRTLTPPNGWTLYNLRDMERAFTPDPSAIRKP